MKIEVNNTLKEIVDGFSRFGVKEDISSSIREIGGGLKSIDVFLRLSVSKVVQEQEINNFSELNDEVRSAKKMIVMHMFEDILNSLRGILNCISTGSRGESMELVTELIDAITMEIDRR